MPDSFFTNTNQTNVDQEPTQKRPDDLGVVAGDGEVAPELNQEPVLSEDVKLAEAKAPEAPQATRLPSEQSEGDDHIQIHPVSAEGAGENVAGQEQPSEVIDQAQEVVPKDPVEAYKKAEGADGVEELASLESSKRGE